MKKKILIIASVGAILGAMAIADILAFRHQRYGAGDVASDPRSGFALQHIHWPEGVLH